MIAIIKKTNNKNITHNLWRLGRPEKFKGMDPLRKLFDRSLQKFLKNK